MKSFRAVIQEHLKHKEGLFKKALTIFHDEVNKGPKYKDYPEESQYWNDSFKYHLKQYHKHKDISKKKKDRKTKTVHKLISSYHWNRAFARSRYTHDIF